MSKVKLNLTKAKTSGTLWEGPEGKGKNGGITFSALSKFLTCRERFRVAMIEGVKPEEKFNHRLEYGQMWHTCEEALAASTEWKQTDWNAALLFYCQTLSKKFPMDREQINHWYQICKRQFPLYIKYWVKHADVKNRVPLLQEQVFDVPYLLPSGRVVRLRGKWDSVDLLKNQGGIFLKENKTKGDIDEMGLKRQLTFDLQTMIYLCALEKYDWVGTPYGPPQGKTAKLPTILPPIKGVVYNVVRRPLSGGKGSIRRHQATNTKLEEPLDSFYDRAIQYVKDEPETYFMRWTVNVGQHDIDRFKRECLNPILEQLCVWYERVTCPTGEAAPFDSAFGWHWRHPFGAVNSIDEYGFGEVDEYLNSGSMVGLRKVDKLFTELQ